jgi:hypothetical protein
MNAAVAGFLGTCIGTFGTLAVTWLTKHYEEKKARRELMVKTAWDYWAKGFDAAQTRGAQTAPFEAFMFHALKIIELADHKSLSNKQLRDELKKIREFTDTITDDSRNR